MFKTDHLIPTEKRMVVTKANPEERTVSEINAARPQRNMRAYWGKTPNNCPHSLLRRILLLLRLGRAPCSGNSTHFENGDLIFFSAIDEGLVLTLADPMDMSDHLEKEMAKLSQERAPDIVWHAIAF